MLGLLRFGLVRLGLVRLRKVRVRVSLGLIRLGRTPDQTNKWLMDLGFTLCKLQLMFWPSSLWGVLPVAGEMKV